YGKQDIRFEDSKEPIVEKDDDVIIKVKAVGTCGSDISSFHKLGPYVDGMTFGHEFSGEVIEVGTGVKNFEVGDGVAGCPALCCGHSESWQERELARCDQLRVAAAHVPGAYADYIKLPEEKGRPSPDSADYGSAARDAPSAVGVCRF